jgi:hypothetical protein
MRLSYIYMKLGAEYQIILLDQHCNTVIQVIYTLVFNK